MSGRLQGRVAIVTGAAHGIGAATARCFVAEGAAVVLADVSERGLAALAAELGDAAHAVRCDVAVPDDLVAAVEQAVTAFGGLDILFNNAAAGAGGRIEELDPADWDRVFAVNVGGVLHGIRAAVPAIRERGGGAILNTSSVAGRCASPGIAAYAASKAAVESLTRTAALELRADGIRVNAIVPGLVRTRAAEASAPFLVDALGTDPDGYVAARQGRWGAPEEIAAVAVHLVSDEASLTTGQCYVLDNGATSRA
ncbi:MULTISPECIES: SDR family NAD(P)-dependent oxidoreductase [Pseudonocardia]|uniref:3-alpha-(Or 20-beta)-hydroxysteroid dehydrogenase n=2 Tax=Pseudonocardia TaxID=1847 RepID=A0A1Y2N3R9_PSEAH|nr:MULTISPECIES: glucose 1-dehydrogenase [Pseudonocardia]OSY42122.1 3-alpha-(or 20-beta)-hydroxysteroid dehydrogenase [Pseudonocardia autotrophica]TDN75110.1 3alpha(or 20beta)-hydroxysteroid dehydrogenase [Pseudonocardia autotrophica]BBF99055.1 3-alpha-(or 20-beta)-hydroxysteroid dehydrogenase [Pseudonocardia autotrophica]GEC23975.1 3-alpha-(or 20-beta)-hydroxysteroid dehydrogenase [Pseudonocardia saturnea]